MSQEPEQVPDSWEIKKQVRGRLLILGGAWLGAMFLSIVVLYSVGLAENPPSWLAYSFPLYWVVSFVGTTGLGVMMILQARRAESMAGLGLGIVATLLPLVLIGRSVVLAFRELYLYWK
jgi:hypothetical protein